MRFAEIQETQQLNEFFPALIPALGILVKGGLAAWTAYEIYQIYKELRSVYAAYKDGWIEINELIQKFGEKAVVAVAEFIAILAGVKVVVAGGKIAFKGAKKAFPNLTFKQFKSAWNQYKAKAA
jgi:hypothetical protein